MGRGCAAPFVGAPVSDGEAACLLNVLGSVKRTHLVVLWAGTHHKVPSSDRLRLSLQKTCRAMTNATGGCVDLTLDLPLGKNSTLTNMAKAVETYATTHFILQPLGDTPMRAAIFDGLAALCIPVFFADCADSALVFEVGYSPFLPPHERVGFGVGSWAVLLNATAARANPSYIQTSLEAIDDATRNCLRRNLRRIWPRILYPQKGANLSVLTAPDIYERHMAWHGLAPPIPLSVFKHVQLEHCARP